MDREILQYFYWKNATHESIDVVHPYYNVKNIQTRQYLSMI